MAADAAMVSLFKAELELCKVGPGQTMAVLSEGEVRADYAQAFLTAGQQLGATTFHINLPPKLQFGGFAGNMGKTSLAGNRPAIEALKGADIVIDLMFLLFSEEQLEITNSGTRMLLVLEPVEVLTRMFPNAELRRRVEVGASLLKNGKVMRITSPHGTDVTYRLGAYPVMTEYGFTDSPGRWDHWPSGFMFTGAHDDGVNGQVVMGPGDIICAFRRYVESPVKFTIEKGYVTNVEGTGLEASLIRNYMKSFNDKRAYAISHIGWGLNDRADWHHMAVADPQKEIGMDALAYYGNVLFSTGPNSELGGTNDTPCHLDMPLRGCTLTLDGELIVKDGEVVPKELRAPGR
ncbi:MAG: leucyl aminopeptidase [Alphaproteobacteria bacterium]|nr:leucyl aminopeptidase [Alphaproteobacteria bacterium]